VAESWVGEVSQKGGACSRRTVFLAAMATVYSGGLVTGNREDFSGRTAEPA
jgi:hypothetical protein